MFDVRIIVLGIYLLAMLAIGLYFYQKNKNVSDYVLGGRQLNPWVAAMSAQASDMSGWLLLGLPGLAYCFRIVGSGQIVTYESLYEAIWTGIGLLIGTYFNWLFVAKRLRKYTEVAGDSVTLSEFFSNRFHDKKKILKMVSAIVIIIAFTMYTAAQFSAGAKLFEAIFGLNYHVALIIGSFVIIAYTFLGGFLAVCWTDLIQGLLMFGALIVIPIVTLNTVGGFGNVQNYLFSLSGGELGSFNIISGASPSLVISSLAWGLGYCGMPHILVRFMGIRKAEEIRPARIIAMIWVVLSMFGAIIAGFLAIGYLQAGAMSASEAESVIIMLITEMFPRVMQGILLSAILAAIMSTADSQLLVASAAFAEDIYSPFASRKKARYTDEAWEKHKMWVSRFSVLVIALLAVLMAVDRNSSVFRIVQSAWGLLGAAFGPTVLTCLYWKRMTFRGAVAGMISGAVVDILFKVMSGIGLPGIWGSIFSVYELLPGFIAGIIAIILFSLTDKEPNVQIQEEFQKATST